ncbi:serine hydrolase [Virgibacillus sp. NKC19-3]|uniref:serine hydrolase n=1 Tax=Virgibacillus saliphilus TaxID=2831674 RepID=UPI001C9A568C|nr:serine hydrolase [Virgibacillus sp. NKC19-3]MBY7142559.1 serine hydrolase [Virgibacillus sp. NKC19-3]
MAMFQYLVLLFIILFAIMPLFKKGQRTTYMIFRAVATTFIVLIGMFLSFLIPDFGIILFLAVVLLVLLLEKWFYTTKFGIVLLIVLLAGSGTGVYYFFYSDPAIVSGYLEETDTTSLYLSIDGEVKIDTAPGQERPLASTVKIMIAAAYAEQVASGELDPEALVPLEELGTFYLANSDGGAHADWLASVEDDITDSQIPLQDVAQGMIVYSSNANAEYLLDLIGFDSIDERMEAWGMLDEQETLVPLVSSLLLVDDLGEEVENLSHAEIRERSVALHSELESGERTLPDSFHMSSSLQRIWSDSVTSASAASYGDFLREVQTGEWGNAEENAILRDLLEDAYLFEDADYLGGKGGSTGFVLNQALYAKLDTGEEMELVFFMDDLNIFQQKRVARSSNDFLIEVLSSENYRNALVNQFGK